MSEALAILSPKEKPDPAAVMRNMSAELEAWEKIYGKDLNEKFSTASILASQQVYEFTIISSDSL